ncbi:MULTISPECIES: NUDIX domain-containing protein [Paenibacillus]|uniref:NUDIX domain-containing protein n=1 Tax=Paenibacillus TaxID=44249 RepID=UPI002692DF95
MTGKIVVVLKAVIIHQGRILILKRSSSDEVGAGGWETAGGNLEFGEDLDTALIREIKEEAGIFTQVSIDCCLQRHFLRIRGGKLCFYLICAEPTNRT